VARLLRPKHLPEPTLHRLPIYQRIAGEWAKRGERQIDSTNLGDLAGASSTTVRRDLSYLGPLGTRGAGYDPNVLFQKISEVLGSQLHYDVVVIGMGNLGRALVNSTSFLVHGAKIVGIYDCDPQVVGTRVGEHTVHAIEDGLESAAVGVICVPPEQAQIVAERLVASKVSAILNFAPQVLNVPLGTVVRYVDFSIELQIVMYHLTNGTGPLGGGILHTLGITPPVALRST
jgi:redox-sensing transcriptional repressor